MFSSDMQTIIANLWGNIIKLFSGVHFPGTHYSILGIMVYAFISALIIKIIHFLFNSILIPSFREQKGGNNKKIKVAKNRKGDTR